MSWTGYELQTGVGGLWDIDAARSTVYDSAHLISSKTTTEFAEFLMPPGTPDYPGHRKLLCTASTATSHLVARPDDEHQLAGEHAASVDISARRGYHFVPKYVLGRPADTLNQGRPLPARVKQAIDSRLLRFTGDPTRVQIRNAPPAVCPVRAHN